MLLFQYAHTHGENIGSPFLECSPHNFKTTGTTMVQWFCWWVTSESLLRKDTATATTSKGVASHRADVTTATDVGMSECVKEGGGGWECHHIGCGHTLHSGRQQAPALGFPNPTVYLWGEYISLKTWNTCIEDRVLAVPSVTKEWVVAISAVHKHFVTIFRGI